MFDLIFLGKWWWIYANVCVACVYFVFLLFKHIHLTHSTKKKICIVAIFNYMNTIFGLNMKLLLNNKKKNCNLYLFDDETNKKHQKNLESFFRKKNEMFLWKIWDREKEKNSHTQNKKDSTNERNNKFVTRSKTKKSNSKSKKRRRELVVQCVSKYNFRFFRCCFF